MKTKQVAKLKPKHELAAMLLAEGSLTVGAVAAKVELSETQVHRLKERDDFRQLIEYYKEKFLSKVEEGIRGRLVADAPRNVDFLVKTRDGDFDDDEKRMRIRMDASKELFGRQVPKREEGEKGGVTIVISNEVADRIRMAEVEEGRWADED